MAKAPQHDYDEFQDPSTVSDSNEKLRGEAVSDLLAVDETAHDQPRLLGSNDKDRPPMLLVKKEGRSWMAWSRPWQHRG